ncbi:hypothetical protein ABZ746_33870 [Streptomyces sp. NPDC020096]
MRTVARYMAAMLSSAAGALFLVPAAHAAPATLLCGVGSQVATYRPPITNQQ